ncbi:hypothetical protein D8S78_05085 [Natrialba swarupiae]|nr:hypothetical protein [Natrialba swarupiae]
MALTPVMFAVERPPISFLSASMTSASQYASVIAPLMNWPASPLTFSSPLTGPVAYDRSTLE